MNPLNRWINYAFPSTAEDMGIFRILFMSVLLLITSPKAMWLANTPDAFFNPPPGLPSLFSTFPPYEAILLANFLMYAAIVAILVGWRTRLFTVVYVLSLLMLNTWSYSVGKINHNFLLIALPLILGFAGWGNALSLDARYHPEKPQSQNVSWGVALCVLVIELSMWTAGWAKFSTGWLDLDHHATLSYMLGYVYVHTRDTWVSLQMLNIDSHLFWELLDWGAVLMELGFFLALVHRRWFYSLAALAIFFHLGVIMMFMIVFWTNVLAYGVGVRYKTLNQPALCRRWLTRFARRVGKIPGPALIAVVCVLAAIRALIVGNNATFQQTLGVTIVLIGCGFAFAWTIHLVRAILLGLSDLCAMWRKP